MAPRAIMNQAFQPTLDFLHNRKTFILFLFGIYAKSQAERSVHVIKSISVEVDVGVVRDLHVAMTEQFR